MFKGRPKSLGEQDSYYSTKMDKDNDTFNNNDGQTLMKSSSFEASMKFIPPEPGQSWKCQIPLNNTASKKFEIEANKHQKIS